MSNEIKFSELEGKGVITSDGREIGDVADLIVDHSSWSVQVVIVKLERELLEDFHMKRPMFGTQTYKVPTSYISGVGDKVLLGKKLEELTSERASAATSDEDE